MPPLPVPPEVGATGCPMCVPLVFSRCFLPYAYLLSTTVIDLMLLAFLDKSGILVENTVLGEWEPLRSSARLVAPCRGIGRPGFSCLPGCDGQVTPCLTCLF